MLTCRCGYAYVGPRVSQYLGQDETHHSDKGFGGDFYVVQSTGGLFPSEHAHVGCVRMLESGPAAGVIGAQAICAQLGMGDAIAFDMGGTTAKAGVISKGRPLTTGSALIGGYAAVLRGHSRAGQGGRRHAALRPAN